MNKRIRELAYQADLIIKKSNGNDFRFGAMDPNLETFAELIVRECLEQVRDEVQYEYDWKLADAVSERVKKHFGVEE